MLKSIRSSFWSLALLVLLPVSLAAQGFLYTDNDTVPNSVTAYSFGLDGALTQIPYQQNDPASTFPTMGNGSNGGFYSSNRIIVVGDFLYVSNSGNNPVGNNPAGTSISAFAIGPTGYLKPVNNGIPFSTGAFNGTPNSGVSLAATPDGKYLYAGSTGTDTQFNLGSIAIFNIDPTTGALTPTNKSPVAAGGPMSSMKVSPDGKYLVAALPTFNSKSGAIAVFAIHGPGTPHEVHNSPYLLSSGPATSLEFNCAGNLLFAGGTGGYIYVFNFASGKLTPVTLSPFTTGTTANRAVVLSKGDSTLFASDPSKGIVNAFAVDTNANGDLTLTLARSSDADGSGAFNAGPGGLAVSNDGDFLFSADQSGDANGDTAGFSMFNLPTSSSIGTSLLTPTVQASGFHSLAVYPPKACTGAAAATTIPSR
jgi:6-phosphogluconolactonase (cycloisomerase 2 family)